MKLAVVQTNPVFGDVKLNVKTALSMMESVDAGFYILPELFNTGYSFIDTGELSVLAETAGGYTVTAITAFAAKKSCYVVLGFAEKGDKMYNSAALIGPGGIAGIYRKTHLFYREKLVFSPGDSGFRVFDLPVGRIGIMICFDWIFPEAARSLALSGAQLIAHPSNLILPHCPDAMVTRCLENRVFAATANRVGSENRDVSDLRFIGKSQIVTPKGEILRRMSSDQPGLATAEIDLSQADNKSATELNHLFADRRSDLYNL